MKDKTSSRRPAIWQTPLGWVMLAAGAAGAYFLMTKHFDHVVQALPYLILLACPLMHVFMHRGHGHDGHHEGKKQPPQ